ncbi:PEP-CTERM sorting domain-containing protein [Chlorogloeopsis fritschii]|nr:PEP-CTERM sorting domain-containing protein [Chlorogloeopsis fritschii]
MKATAFFSILVAGVSSSIMVDCMPAVAATVSNFQFQNILGGDTIGDAYAPDFSFSLSDNGAGRVVFKFSNQGSFPHALKQVAFSVDPTMSGILSNILVNVDNSAGVNFQFSTQNLSQSNHILGWDGTTFGARTQGGNANSVQPTESLGIQFNGNYEDVLAAINSGTLKVGIHVGSLPGGASDSYVNTPVPEPCTILGTGMAFGIGGLLKRKYAKRWNQQKASV